MGPTIRGRQGGPGGADFGTGGWLRARENRPGTGSGPQPPGLSVQAMIGFGGLGGAHWRQSDTSEVKNTSGLTGAGKNGRADPEGAGAEEVSTAVAMRRGGGGAGFGDMFRENYCRRAATRWRTSYCDHGGDGVTHGHNEPSDFPKKNTCALGLRSGCQRGGTGSA